MTDWWSFVKTYYNPVVHQDDTLIFVHAMEQTGAMKKVFSKTHPTKSRVLTLWGCYYRWATEINLDVQAWDTVYLHSDNDISDEIKACFGDKLQSRTAKIDMKKIKTWLWRFWTTESHCKDLDKVVAARLNINTANLCIFKKEIALSNIGDPNLEQSTSCYEKVDGHDIVKALCNHQSIQIIADTHNGLYLFKFCLVDIDTGYYKPIRLVKLIGRPGQIKNKLFPVVSIHHPAYELIAKQQVCRRQIKYILIMCIGCVDVVNIILYFLGMQQELCI